MMSGEMILVVGGAGYIGSHMVLRLLEAGYRVLVLDNLSTGHCWAVPEEGFFKGDLGDPDRLETLFSRFEVAAVMHFAAFSLVGESVQDPLKYYRNNIAATVNLLRAMVRHQVRRFIFSSSAAVYGEPTTLPISEEHPCRPTNPYGASKLAVEQLLEDCRRAYGLRYISLRYFNAAGAHDSGCLGEEHQPESHLIPLVLQVATGERPQLLIYGTDYPTPDGTCLRDYVHVSDLCDAHLLALERLLSREDGSGVYNLGNSKGYSVREVIEVAGQVTGRVIPVKEAGRRAGDPAALVADSRRARRRLGWHPRYEDLSAIIRSAWQWHAGRCWPAAPAGTGTIGRKELPVSCK